MKPQDVLEYRTDGNGVIAGDGLISKIAIPGNVKLLQYYGPLYPESLAEAEFAREMREVGSFYGFYLVDDWWVDGYTPYNLARLVNHSCEPNCEFTRLKKPFEYELKYHDGLTKTIKLNTQIWYQTIKAIMPGEELTTDYCVEFDPEETYKHPCLCGQPTCCGYIVAGGEVDQLTKWLPKWREKGLIK